MHYHTNTHKLSSSNPCALLADGELEMYWLLFTGPLLHQKPATGSVTSVAELRTDLAAATTEASFTLWVEWGGGSKHFLFVLSLI